VVLERIQVLMDIRWTKEQQQQVVEVVDPILEHHTHHTPIPIRQVLHPA